VVILCSGFHGRFKAFGCISIVFKGSYMLCMGVFLFLNSDKALLFPTRPYSS
jgi:hypothetical protein